MIFGNRLQPEWPFEVERETEQGVGGCSIQFARRTIVRRIICRFLVICLLALAARAQTKQRDMERERAIMEQLQKVAPKVVPLFRAGTDAFDRSNYSEAAQLYE